MDHVDCTYINIVIRRSQQSVSSSHNSFCFSLSLTLLNYLPFPLFVYSCMLDSVPVCISNFVQVSENIILSKYAEYILSFKIKMYLVSCTFSFFFKYCS